MPDRNDIVLTDEEKKAIAALRRVEKIWPDTLWIFCTGTMHVMRKGPNGEHMIVGGQLSGGSVDQDYYVTALFGIDNDGGGW